MPPMMIAIDGHAGAGKGTLTRRLSQIYNLDFLDTGLLYRAVGLKMLEKKENLNHKEAAIQMARSLQLKDLKDSALREEKVGNAASQIAHFPEVREILLKFQRDFAKNPRSDKQGVILDGRDIGLVVLPEAPCKIYITASIEVRARRRLKELHEKGIDCIYEAVLEDMERRDKRDQTREASPLRPAEEAFIIDSSDLSIEDVVKQACVYIDSKYSEASKSFITCG